MDLKAMGYSAMQLTLLGTMVTGAGMIWPNHQGIGWSLVIGSMFGIAILQTVKTLGKRKQYVSLRELANIARDLDHRGRVLTEGLNFDLHDHYFIGALILGSERKFALWGHATRDGKQFEALKQVPAEAMAKPEQWSKDLTWFETKQGERFEGLCVRSGDTNRVARLLVAECSPYPKTKLAIRLRPTGLAWLRSRLGIEQKQHT